ncbi:MAG: ATP-binding protein, partial [Gemmatimonadales bacterium]
MSDSHSTPPTEIERLAALRRAELLDTPPEEVFDRLTRLASVLLRAPVAVVSLVDADREFIKSSVGLPDEWKGRRETARCHSLAEIAIAARSAIAIEDARVHPLVKDNPVLPALGAVSYAAVPLLSREGHALGSVYVLDKEPRAWTANDIAALTAVAAAAETEIALRVALRETERARAAMKTVLEHVPYAVLTVDHDWRCTFVNDKAEELLRPECTPMLGESLWSACPHIAGTALESQLRHAQASATNGSFDGYFSPLDAWYEASAEASEEGLTVFFKDVSAKKRASDALGESERRYRFVFEEGLACNLVTAPDGHFFACNQSFVAALGFASMEEALSANSRSLWQDVSKRDSVLEALRTRGRFGPAEVEIRRVDGVALTATLTAVARFEGGVLTEIHSSLLDITEQKKLEAQFRQAQKMEAVGQLAGGMAHDFNNLLTVIKAYVQLALVELDEGVPLRADIKVIGDAADRAAELTRQLLAFSRQQVLLPQRVNLRAIVTGIEPLVRTLLGPEITLVADVTRVVPDIEADRSQLEQVLMNLAVNARDAMPGGGSLTFAIGHAEITRANQNDHPGAPPGSYATLAVRDSGAGMPPEVVTQIFEPFFTTKGPGKGTGLGLSTVYGIVKQSGGHVCVMSAVGNGTTFTIYLPASREASNPPRRTSVDDRAAVRALGGRTVLVVDDD